MKAKRKVLILGGNGFIGSNLTRLLSENAEYDAASFDCAEPAVRLENVTYLTGDFFNDLELRDLVQEYDVIYHAVSTLNPGNSNRLYLQGYERDFVQSVHLCEYVHQLKKKMIFLSSGGTVYGKHSEKERVSEEDFCRPINHYGTVKHCIENVMLSFTSQNPEDQMIIARLSNPYGPGQDYRKGVGVIDALLKNAIHGTPMTVWGDGEVVRDYIHIEDACGMLAALAKYEGKDRVFNLSSGLGYSVNDLIAIVRDLYPQLEVIYQAARSVDIPRIVLDNRRILRVFNRSLIPIETGIRQYAQHIEKQKAEEQTP